MSDYTYNEIVSKAKSVKNTVEKEYTIEEDNRLSYYFAKAILKPKQSISKIVIKPAEKSSGNYISRDIYYSNYKDMATRLVEYVESKGRLPNFVTYKENYRLAVRLYTYFFAKVLVAYENNNQKYVEKVNITSKVFTKPTETGNVVYDYLAKKTGKKFKTIDDLLTYVKSNFTYQYYFDDKKSNKEVIDSKSGNCTDLLQFLINMATAMGYESKCIHVKCKTSGIGHVFGKFKHPKNTNGKWITRDIACVAKDGSITCVWCENGTLLAENPSWFLVNLNR